MFRTGEGVNARGMSRPMNLILQVWWL
jgi:hypothetical protein